MLASGAPMLSLSQSSLKRSQSLSTLAAELRISDDAEPAKRLRRTGMVSTSNLDAPRRKAQHDDDGDESDWGHFVSGARDDDSDQRPIST
eukprot:CAMPEP_0118901090 /NCGR_PEP_ID=MMETSP1166-20130328/6938_1 /TAXON_ID=1104430 /ORGANISM="Chrysoreinhardia sp, Strain CCMP3193" /LENGTH=89 /DNA_ID=CAMNT_0006840253 /DNA_START=33 /DNA_END=302 /DNA_ORIENTATION=-